MLKEQFDRAFALANNSKVRLNVDDSALFGFGLPDFIPVTVPIEAIAKTLRWEALQLNGEWDTVALDACRKAFVYPSRKVEIFETEVVCPHCGKNI